VKIFDVRTPADLAKLLTVAPFEIDAVIFNRARHYRVHSIAKPNGNPRLLHVPEGPLKLLQRKVKSYVLDRVPLCECVHGGIRGRSIKTNAREHVGKEVVFGLDVQDFFPSVNTRTVQIIFEALGFQREPAALLTQITTWNQQLPQGAPTSSSLANLSMTRVDVRLEKLARCHGFAYTRYVDDLTVSGGKRLLDFKKLIVRIVEDEGFRINPFKLRTMLSGERQVVTGLVVNAKLNIPREKRNLIRKNVLAFVRQGGPERVAARDAIRGQLSWVSSVNAVLAQRLLKRGQI
jgi:RNA-directed DNA polymerase